MDVKKLNISSGWSVYYSRNADCKSWAESVTSESALARRGADKIPAEVPGCSICTARARSPTRFSAIIS